MKYSFMYNTRYDDGAIVIGNHLYGLPDDSKYICDCYEAQDWINVGLLSVDDNNNIIVKKKVITNFDFYGGGFQFKYYTLLDKKGDQICLADHPVLLEWLNKTIKEVSSN